MIDIDKVVAEEKASIAGGYGCDCKKLIDLVEQLQKRVAELESAASSLLERAEKPLNLDEILLQQALAPNQCTKCGKQMTAEKIKADGGIHTCMQKG